MRRVLSRRCGIDGPPCRWRAARLGRVPANRHHQAPAAAPHRRVPETMALAGRSVLEVGCGAGRLLGWLAREGAAAGRARPRRPSSRRRARRPRRRRWWPDAARRCPSPRAASTSSCSSTACTTCRSPANGRRWRRRPRAGHRWRAPGRRAACRRAIKFELLQPLDDETEVRAKPRALHAAATLGLRMVREEVYPPPTGRAPLAGRARELLGANHGAPDALAPLEPGARAAVRHLGEPGRRPGLLPAMRLNLLRRRP